MHGRLSLRALSLAIAVLGPITINATSAVPSRAETVPLCFGRTPTIVGTTGNDDGHDNPVLEGTAGADVIVGLEGADYIDGNGGNDYICGNAGADNIDVHEDASDGDDHIYGGGAQDCAVGSWSEAETAINDVIRGGSQSDSCLTGGPGDDFVVGGSGNDFLNGNAGDDILRGNYGDDRIDDTSPGVGDTDRLSGGPGNDSLFANDGDTHDRLDGGTQFVADRCEGDVLESAADVMVDCESPL